MERILNGGATEFQFVAILVATAVEIQAEAASGHKSECFLPVVDIDLYEIPIVLRLVNCNCSLIWK